MGSPAPEGMLFDCEMGAGTSGLGFPSTGTSRTMLAGSDFPLFHLGFAIGMVAHAYLDEADTRTIVGSSGLRLLRPTDWFRPAMLGGKAALAV